MDNSIPTIGYACDLGANETGSAQAPEQLQQSPAIQNDIPVPSGGAPVEEVPAEQE